jgi:hypothetical protein
MQNKMSFATKNKVLELASQLQLPHLPSDSVIPLRVASPGPAPIAAQAESETSHPARHGLGRTLGFLRRLVARIDLKDFPGSCCG